MGSSGKYFKTNRVYRKAMSVADFRKAAFSEEYRNPKPDVDLVELERYASPASKRAYRPSLLVKRSIRI